MSKLSFDQETYFSKVNYHPENNTQEYRSVHRWYPEEDGGTAMEWWNPETGEWEDDPTLFAATGIGGDSDHVVITRERAKALMGTLGHA